MPNMDNSTHCRFGRRRGRTPRSVGQNTPTVGLQLCWKPTQPTLLMTSNGARQNQACKERAQNAAWLRMLWCPCRDRKNGFSSAFAGTRGGPVATPFAPCLASCGWAVQWPEFPAEPPSSCWWSSQKRWSCGPERRSTRGSSRKVPSSKR